jgi:hypothetical protein
MAFSAMLGFVFELSFQNFTVLLLCLLWMYCAFMLWKSPRLWAWVGSLVGVLLLTVQLGAQTLRLLSLVRQASYGDKSIHVDPSTIGIPLFGFAVMTLGAFLLLLMLLSLPVWLQRRHGVPPIISD